MGARRLLDKLLNIVRPMSIERRIARWYRHGAFSFEVGVHAGAGCTIRSPVLRCSGVFLEVDHRLRYRRRVRLVTRAGAPSRESIERQLSQPALFVPAPVSDLARALGGEVDFADSAFVQTPEGLARSSPSEQTFTRSQLARAGVRSELRKPKRRRR